MPTVNYQHILMQVKQLEMIDQLRLLAAIANLAQQQAAAKTPRRIRELRGLGKEVWQGIDAQQYVNQERDAWK